MRRLKKNKNNAANINIFYCNDIQLNKLQVSKHTELNSSRNCNGLQYRKIYLA